MFKSKHTTHDSSSDQDEDTDEDMDVMPVAMSINNKGDVLIEFDEPINDMTLSAEQCVRFGAALIAVALKAVETKKQKEEE